MREVICETRMCVLFIFTFLTVYGDNKARNIHDELDRTGTLFGDILVYIVEKNMILLIFRWQVITRPPVLSVYFLPTALSGQS